MCWGGGSEITVLLVSGLSLSHCCINCGCIVSGKPHEPKEFQVVGQTSISVTVQWTPGFAAGYGPQTFTLEYKDSSAIGKRIYSSDRHANGKSCHPPASSTLDARRHAQRKQMEPGPFLMLVASCVAQHV